MSEPRTSASVPSRLPRASSPLLPRERDVNRSFPPGSPVLMHDLLPLLVKGVAGGGLVVAFALVSEALTPKRFAGLFGAAPAVALAGLAITLIDKGAHDAHEAAVGMIAGAAGMIVYAAAVIRLLRRMRASRAALSALAVWVGAAAIVAIPILAA